MFWLAFTAVFGAFCGVVLSTLVVGMLVLMFHALCSFIPDADKGTG